MPGMTATVSVDRRSEREDVLRMPAAALRFRPEGFDADAPARPARRGARPRRHPAAPARRSGSGGGRGARARRRHGAADSGGRGRRIAGADGAPRGGGDATAGGPAALVFVLDEKGEPQPRARPGRASPTASSSRSCEGLDEGAAVVTGAATAGAPRGAAPRPGALARRRILQARSPQRRQR